jgi:L-asparaginase
LSRKKNLLLLFTGGTISMRIDPGTGGAVPALSGQEIVSSVPAIAEEAQLTLEDYARLPGPHVTPRWMWELKEYVGRRLQEAALDGVVLTHGTDTLEETAFLLDLTLSSAKPVVFCGAMRTVSEAGWDGPANLLAAVRVAAHPDSPGRGVLVALGEYVHAAAEATKWHTQSLAAFRSPHGALGAVERDSVVYYRPPYRTPPLPAPELVPEVDLHTMAAGIDGTLVEASVARGARGLVLEATGAGNIPPGVVPAVRAALAAGLAVVTVSRCPEGRVFPAYGYEGGGRMLRDLGVILGGDLPGPKARIKLMVALGVTRDREALRRLFEQD